MISLLPKIKIKLPPGYPEEEALPFEEAKKRLDFERGMFLVEGQRVHSYNELVRIASQDKYREQEYLEIIAVLFIAGG